jgi:N-acetylmuramoyl-L-alanine amidase
VQQAGFFVLYKVAMHSIFIELGFISNVEEEKLLAHEDTHEMLAASIYNAFVEYINLNEGTTKPLLPVPKARKMEIIIQNTSPVIEPEPVSENTDTVKITEPKPTEPITNNVRFRIQFFSSSENLSTTHKKFSSLSEVKKYKENGVWKYTTGNYTTSAESQKMLKEVKKHFADAFIISFNNEQKISISDAQKLLQ